MLPFRHIATLGAHEVLVIGVGEHMSGEVRLVSAPELAQLALVGLVTCGGKSGMSKRAAQWRRRVQPSHTAVLQHVPLQATFVRRHVAALRAAVGLLVGVQTADVLLELHGVERDKGAKITAELDAPRVAEAPVLEEGGLVGAGEVAAWAVVGQVRAVVSLHVRLAREDGATGVVAAL